MVANLRGDFHITGTSFKLSGKTLTTGYRVGNMWWNYTIVKKGEKKVSPAVPGTGGEIYPTLETSYPYLLVHKPLGFFDVDIF